MNRLLLLVLVIGCREAPPPTAPGALTDDLGRAVVVPVRVERIVSLAPSNTELVFALGAGDRLVGRTEACDFPAEAARVPSVGSLFPPDLERLLLRRPDLVLMIEGHAELRATLTAREIPVLVLQPRGIEGIFSNIRLLGRALALPTEAAALEARLRGDLAAIPPVPGGPTVLYEVWPDPLTAAGPDTFTHDLLRHVGARNLVPAGAWPQLSLETVVHARPDVIIASSKESAAAILGGRRPGLSSTPAARSGRVYVPPDPDWLVRPGPRVVHGVRWLAEVLGM